MAAEYRPLRRAADTFAAGAMKIWLARRRHIFFSGAWRIRRRVGIFLAELLEQIAFIA